MNEKIDFVITWVDGNDEKWLKEKHKYEQLQKNAETEEFKKWINSKARFRDWDNLKYWFRSVEKYAPWVNKIYFVTWGHIPKWLDTNNPKLVIVKHEDFIPKKYLPLFNSHAIELNFGRIKGLSEQFVSFNDDMFITDYVKPTDFFKKGLPCEVAGFECIAADPYINSADINNTKVLNKYFIKKEVIKKNWKKWFKLKYGKYLLKTLALMPWKKITGLAEMHVMCSYKKSNFDLIWEKEYEKCNKTCSTRFRENDNLSHWLVKGWQLLSGDFYPRSAKFGKSYMKKIDDEIIKDILKRKYKAICINDFECTDEEFEEQKKKLNEAFLKTLPKKSSFEK